MVIQQLANLESADIEIYDLILKEEERQRNSICLIASENFAGVAVQEVLGSVLCNKYSEGWPGDRYYPGCQYIDQIERLCCKRALDLFSLDSEEWGVIAQSLSGSPANFAVYTGLLSPGDRILYLDLPHGGHLSHGYQTANKKVSAVAKYFSTENYHVNLQTGLIDYNEVQDKSRTYKPHCIIAGTSAYTRLLDYDKFRTAANSAGAILLVDIAHIAGLIAGACLSSPFPYADIVTTTTHKTLRGPRGALVFYRKKASPYSVTHHDVAEFETRLKAAVFPGLQGGPHQHTIGAIAVALKQALLPDFKIYQRQVLSNAQDFARALMTEGLTLVTDGTDNHMILIDLRPQNLSGSKVSRVCEMANLILNKNTVPGDSSPANPHGIRVGTPAMTSRGMKQIDFEKIASFITRAIKIAQSVQTISGRKLSAFENHLSKNTPKALLEVNSRSTIIHSLCSS